MTNEHTIPSPENKIDPFRDCFGNILPNKRSYRSENPNTFNVAFYFSYLLRIGRPVGTNLNSLTNHIVKNKYRLNNNSWRTMEYDLNPSWSLDEKISTLAYFCHKDDKKYLKTIPYFASFKNSSFWSWLRPDVLAYTFGSKNKWAREFLWVYIIYPKIITSLNKFLKDEKGNSSGVQMAFIMAMGWDRTEFIKDNKFQIMLAMTNYYHEDKAQPTRFQWEIMKERIDIIKNGIRI